VTIFLFKFWLHFTLTFKLVEEMASDLEQLIEMGFSEAKA
jgi:hypothetical protein